MEIRLKALGQLITQCWNEAEGEASKSIAAKYFGPNEEQVTFLFASELRAAIERVSNNGLVAQAFISDLRESVPELRYRTDSRLGGLLARVNFHNPQHEGRRSASDLGISIRRPLVSVDSSHQRIEIRSDHGTGLLAQAKLGIFKEGIEKFRWNGFTKPQQRLFPERSSYYSLLLYRLSGKRRDELKRFGWQLCSDHCLEEAKAWLRTDRFPTEVSSSELLARLFMRSVGTDSAEVIRNIIDPEVPTTQVIELRIFWPKGAEPPPSVMIEQATRQPLQIRLRSG